MRYSEVAPKRSVFSMYGLADVYNYQVIVETPQFGIKMFGNVANALENHYETLNKTANDRWETL